LFLRSNPPSELSDHRVFADRQQPCIPAQQPPPVRFWATASYIYLNFPEIIPETHVSRDPSRLRKIIDDFGGAMVVKPLQRFGGEGVIKVSTRDRMNLNSLIHYYVRAYETYARREPIMVQEYLKSVKQDGDIRILLLNGEIHRRHAPETQERAIFEPTSTPEARCSPIAVTAKREKRVCKDHQGQIDPRRALFCGHRPH
jgi:glutathione synthase